MKFWDSSALVTLHVSQQASALTRKILEGDPEVVAWVLSDVELRSALCRLERDGAISSSDALEAAERLGRTWSGVHVVGLTDSVKMRAKRLLGVHPLRAADALQLAAALGAAYDDPSGRSFVCLDGRLRAAAAREGFSVEP